MSGESVLLLYGTKPWLVTKSTFLKASKHLKKTNQLHGADELCPFQPWICWAFVWWTGLSGSEEAVVCSCLLTARLLLEKKMMIGTPGFHIGIRYVFWKNRAQTYTTLTLYWNGSDTILSCRYQFALLKTVLFTSFYCAQNLWVSHIWNGYCKNIFAKNKRKKNTYL